MIVITGARGFIGSGLVKKLNAEGYTNLILVDELANIQKDAHLAGTVYTKLIDRMHFLAWFQDYAEDVKFVYHLGARTDTAEFDPEVFKELNEDYSIAIIKICTQFKIPIVYASSAATYGNGELGFDDNEDFKQLKPLNPYGWSKQNVDLWLAAQAKTPPFYAGLKFFNVYGPGEEHKGRMASVVYHAYHQIKATGKMKLFTSHHSAYKDGEQLRDFIFIDDLLAMCFFFQQAYEKKQFVASGLYNIGTGKARSFNDLVRATFLAMQIEPEIDYIPMPEDIREKYQYFTEAKMDKIRKAGYVNAFNSLEEGVKKYIGYLSLL